MARTGGTTSLRAGKTVSAIIDDVTDRKDFLPRLEEMTKRFDLEIHAYVVMAKHNQGN